MRPEPNGDFGTVTLFSISISCAGPSAFGAVEPGTDAAGNLAARGRCVRPIPAVREPPHCSHLKSSGERLFLGFKGCLVRSLIVTDDG